MHTGVPFGDYHYTGGLGPHVRAFRSSSGLAWMMMAQPAACVAERISNGRLRVVVAAVALASWDVFLDPQMVDARPLAVGSTRIRICPASATSRSATSAAGCWCRRW